VKPSQDLTEYELQIQTLFIQTFIGQDEWMISNGKHIARIEFVDTSKKSQRKSQEHD
jgi:hypothetical protein